MVLVVEHSAKMLLDGVSTRHSRLWEHLLPDMRLSRTLGLPEADLLDLRKEHLTAMMALPH